MLENLLAALTELLTIKTLILMLLGTFAGLLAGAIPGFTITMAVVLTLPFTFGMTAMEGLATMISVMVGGLSGGLISGMLTGIPGTPSSVATTFDGFPMVRQGRVGLALGLGVWSSFFGGIFSAVLLVVLAPNLASIGLEFGAWDYFSLVIFALTITASLSGDNLLKGLIAGMLGLFVATIGVDDISGVERFTFGIESLADGFTFLPVLIGLFAFSQLMGDIRDRDRARAPLMEKSAKQNSKIAHLEAIRTIFRSKKNLLRSSLLGVFTGILPAAGSSIANILAYDQAKKNSPESEQFGHGHPDGIIAPESANNATAGGALISMMALGIPGDVVTAVMLGALMIHNIVPSPSFIHDQPVLAYGLFAAFFLAHFMMIFLQSLCLRVFVRITVVPLYILAGVILAYCSVGVFALHNSEFDLVTLLVFGLLGYMMIRLGFPLPPMILGVVLGRIAEVNLSRAVGTNDNLWLFLTRPWSLFFIIAAGASLLFPIYQKQKNQQKCQRENPYFADYYINGFSLLITIPLWMMPGSFRKGLAIALGLWVVYRLIRRFLRNQALKIQ